MQVKATRTVSGPWHPSIHHAANVIDRVWRALCGKHPRVTGLGEEGHSERSKHYGELGDVRIRAIDIDADFTAIPEDLVDAVDRALRERLGIDYDIVWERMGTPHAHLHIEYDPKEVVL